jgi:polyhydroxybutyrate depolymerase
VLFDEAESVFGALFPGPQPNQTFGPYTYRYYPRTGNYLAVTASDIVLLGPVVGNSVNPVTYASLASFCGAPATAKFCGFKHRRTVMVDGIEREFIVYVPWKSRNVENLPVVFMLHGTSGDGEEFFSRSGWREMADSEGLIAVFPSSLRYCYFEDDVTVNGIFEPNERKTFSKWNAGKLGDPTKLPLCTAAQIATLPPATRAAVDHPLADDVAFFDRMVADLNQNFRVNPKRMYVSGFSSGGQMSTRLAMERSTVFAALASAAGGTWEPMPLAARPPSFIYSVGEVDPNVTSGWGIPSVPLTDLGASILFSNNIVAPLTTPLQLDRTRYSYGLTSLYGKQVSVHSYSSSTASPAAGNTLHIAVIEGATHEYPNGDNHPVKLPEVLWNFFKPLTLP